MTHFLTLDGRRLEYVWFGPPPGGEGPCLVLLHEGLGSIALWRDFPEKLAAATGCRVLVYSRLGYGASDPCDLPRPLDYMQREAREGVPRVLAALGVGECVLIGHSDGGSIALAYAGGPDTARLRGLILEAPHVFVEDFGLRAIAAARDAYAQGDLRARLQKYHSRDVDCAFWGWCDAWLDPDFRRWNIENFLPNVRAPCLVLQGADDQYGTLAQVEAIEKGVRGPVETRVLADCGHSPHVDQTQATLEAMAAFIDRLRP